MEKIKKIKYICMGILSFVLGAIGAFVPILPTTPFLLLTLFCFSKGSKRCNDWFVETKLYKKYLEEFVKNRAMTLRQKIYILLFADTMIAIPIIVINNIHVRLFLIVLILFKYYYFIHRIKTIKVEDHRDEKGPLQVDIYEQQNR